MRTSWPEVLIYLFLLKCRYLKFIFYIELAAEKSKRQLFGKSSGQRAREKEQRAREEKEEADHHARSKSLLDRVKQLAQDEDQKLTLEGIVDVLDDNYRKILLYFTFHYFKLR